MGLSRLISIKLSTIPIYLGNKGPKMSFILMEIVNGDGFASEKNVFARKIWKSNIEDFRKFYKRQNGSKKCSRRI